MAKSYDKLQVAWVLVKTPPTTENRGALIKAAGDSGGRVRKAAASALVALVKAAPQHREAVKALTENGHCDLAERL